MPPPTLNSEEPLMHLLVLGAFWQDQTLGAQKMYNAS